MPLAQLDRVFGYEPKGRGFESLMARQKEMHLHLLFCILYISIVAEVASTEIFSKIYCKKMNIVLK